MNKSTLFILSFFTFFLFVNSSITAQETETSCSKITGNILDADNEPAMYASIVLKSSADSSMVDGTISDESGNFSLENVSCEDYFIEITYVGFDQYTSEVFTMDEENIELPLVQLEPLSNEWGEFVVTAARPLVEVEVRSDLNQVQF